MSNLYTRQAAAFRNEMRQSCAALMGIVQGVLADTHLHDQEIRFLRNWLDTSEDVRLTWPGNVIHAQIEQVLADGVITEDERKHLTGTLLQLLGGTLDDLAENRHVTQLPIDDLTQVEFSDRVFCFTGEFVFGPKSVCERAVEVRGGAVSNAVSRKLHYLVVGGLGSAEWKHGSFGTKIKRAVEFKEGGAQIKIVHEDTWASSLSLYRI